MGQSRIRGRVHESRGAREDRRESFSRRAQRNVLRPRRRPIPTVDRFDPLLLERQEEKWEEPISSRKDFAVSNLLSLTLNLRFFLQYENNPRARVALVAAKYEDLVLEEIETNPFAEGGPGAAYLAKFPLGLVRFLLPCF